MPLDSMELNWKKSKCTERLWIRKKMQKNDCCKHDERNILYNGYSKRKIIGKNIIREERQLWMQRKCRAIWLETKNNLRSNKEG